MSKVVAKCKLKNVEYFEEIKTSSKFGGKKKSRLVKTRFVKFSDEQLIGLHQVGSISYTVR